MKRISYQNMFIAIGGFVCLLAFIWGANSEDRELPSKIFFIGAGFAAIGIFLNLLLLNYPRPLKLFVVGVLVACIGMLFESTSTQVLLTLKVIGFITTGVAVAWYAYEIVHND